MPPTKKGATLENEPSTSSTLTPTSQQRTALLLIERLSNENKQYRREKERVASFLTEVSRLVRAMRSEYDSTFTKVQDDLKALRYDWKCYIDEVIKQMEKQRQVLEEERKRFRNGIKRKELQIEKLQGDLIGAEKRLVAAVHAVEVKERLVSIAQREAFTADESRREMQRKMKDELWMAENKKCLSCQANERMRETLSNEIAEKTSHLEQARTRITEVDGQLQQQRRVNEVLSKSVDKHTFAERTIRSEFERIKVDYEKALGEVKAQKTLINKLTSGGGGGVVNGLDGVMSVATPPDSEKSSKDDPVCSGGQCEPCERTSPEPTSSPAQVNGMGPSSSTSALLVEDLNADADAPSSSSAAVVLERRRKKEEQPRRANRDRDRDRERGRKRAPSSPPRDQQQRLPPPSKKEAPFNSSNGAERILSPTEFLRQEYEKVRLEQLLREPPLIPNAYMRPQQAINSDRRARTPTPPPPQQQHNHRRLQIPAPPSPQQWRAGGGPPPSMAPPFYSNTHYNSIPHPHQLPPSPLRPPAINIPRPPEPPSARQQQHYWAGIYPNQHQPQPTNYSTLPPNNNCGRAPPHSDTWMNGFPPQRR